MPEAQSSSGVRKSTPPWHTMGAQETLESLGADPTAGHSESRATEIRGRFGSNSFDEAKPQSALRRVAKLLADRMTIVLVVAAAVSAAVSREWETPVVILLVITLNTTLNFVQERRAENSLDALRSSTAMSAIVLRDGVKREVPNSELVPGDIVSLDAGDSVPADGRLLEAVRLQVAEASLTGEAEPVTKSIDSLELVDLALAERSNMVFMNTEVTRGRGVMVITETGMATQIGHVATSLDRAGLDKTPLQRRTDQLAKVLTIVAIVVVALVFVLGLVRGQSSTDLLITAVSLAVATIPEGLTAVVTFTLAMGASRMAKRGAIIKRLSAVETLGSTTDIATDKTGTLTLNQMTVHQIIACGRVFRVTGEGYSVDGSILSRDDRPVDIPMDVFLAMALCNDATLAAGRITGDPTEAALVVLAEKGGLDVDGARATHPRVAEIPFDSEYKFMATFHEQTFESGDLTPARYRCFAKGAPGALLDRADSYLGPEGIRLLGQAERDRLAKLTQEIAAGGMRTLLIAGRRIDAELPDDEDLLREGLSGLTVYAIVGIVDPPRTEVRQAIERLQGAGIAVHMITGDSEATASAIARELRIPGLSASGNSLDSMESSDLAERAPGIGVLARVSPEHKIRFVRALQSRGAVVGMTGDGVNDAPALTQADIGIAMGITGTDVSKNAADMILTDDNFATIVAAVEGGRGVYENIVKFVKFQLSTSWGFVLIFIVCSVFGIAGGAPFTALQILLVNLIMDGPPALALGVDPVDPDIMKQKPRPVNEPLLTRSRFSRVLLFGGVMAAGTIAVLVFADRWFEADASDPLFPTTLAFTTFVFFQIFNILNVRSERGSVFSRATFSNRSIWLALGAVVIVQIAVINNGFLQSIFDTTALTLGHWAAAVAIASTILWVEELRKLIARLGARRERARTAVTVSGGRAPLEAKG